MYSKEEGQKIKREFWIEFAEKYPKKWILYNTKIKDFSFKFYADNKKVQVLLDIEMRDALKRELYFEKIESLKSILEEQYIQDLVFESNFTLETEKKISRIWVEKLQVSINNKNNWEEIFDFFNLNMTQFECFFLEYEEYIKNI
jgi:hypothetical protein